MIARSLATVSLALTLGACVYPEFNGSSRPSSAFSLSDETALGAHAAEQASAHPGDTALVTLGSGLDAFAARVAAIEAAERAIDLQTYILHDDVTGGVLALALLDAADRGVRVRLLVDDLGSGGIDELLAGMNQHPLVEVRLFNPRARGPWNWLAQTLDLMGRPRRVNHRMHNKLLAVDGAIGVIGGRNIGDEYFDAAEGVNFGDLDLLAFGPVATELGECFDRYWNSEYTERLEGWSSFDRDDEALPVLRAELVERRAAAQGSAYARRVETTDFVRDVTNETLSVIWAATHAFADDPRKIVADLDEIRDTLLITQLDVHMPEARTELLVVSPYFVPREEGVQHLVAAAERGVRVRVLTNSLAGSDVPIVHAGYARYRRDLLEGGVELYEFQPAGDDLLESHRRGMFGSKSASLHAKTFVIDQEHVFVGSLNLDPRSVDLNTEIGLVVRSRELAQEITTKLERALAPSASWRVTLEGDELVWRGIENGEAKAWDAEPRTSWWDRFGVWCLGWLPIEGQL